MFLRNQRNKMNEANAVKGSKVSKFITGHNLKIKGKKYKEIEFETLGVDNSSKMVKLRIIAPKNLFGMETPVKFSTLRRGPFLKTDTSKKTKREESKMSLKLEELVGKPITEAQFDEAAGKKDACYHKVKARYDVWPSAYASGALVKCRKVGAANWGNKSKKEDVYYESITENGITETHVYWESDGKPHGYTFAFVNELNEAEYQGRKVKLGKIMQGDTKKFKVYVKNPKGNVVKVNFGQGGGAKGGTMRIRKSNPKARANFRARHNCDNPGPRHKARYWSCRKW